MVRVSVIVPVYNTEKYLRRCLDSLVKQTIEGIEIILIDDGSTDTSYEILMEYKAKYPEKIIVIRKENGGQASARNIGIKLSRGKYIGFVDSDDYVDTGMFKALYDTAVLKNCDMVECHYRYLCEEGKRIKEYKTRGVIRQYKNQRDMFINPQASPCNKLFRREALMHEGVDFPEGYIYEDTAFYIKTIPFIKKEQYVDKHYYYYLLRSSSTMNSHKCKRVGDIFPVLLDILDFYRKYDLDKTYHSELEYFCVKILLCSSLSRIGRVKDHDIAKELYNKTFSFIRKHFPDYKQNKYLQGKIGVYIRLVRRWNCKYIGWVLGKAMKG